MNHDHGNEPCTLCWMMYPMKMNTTLFPDVAERLKEWNENHWTPARKWWTKRRKSVY